MCVCPSINCRCAHGGLFFRLSDRSTALVSCFLPLKKLRSNIWDKSPRSRGQLGDGTLFDAFGGIAGGALRGYLTNFYVLCVRGDLMGQNGDMYRFPIFGGIAGGALRGYVSSS